MQPSYYSGKTCEPSDALRDVRGLKLVGADIEVRSLEVTWNGFFMVQFASEEDAIILREGSRSAAEGAGAPLLRDEGVFG